MNYEKLGVFYLGKRFDLASGQRLAEPLLYDSRDLTTHAVCVGMTGSGKTGLGITVIEEAALDGIPVLAIDPKGDLANLLLTFPGLSARDFAPWVDPADAARRGLSPDALAAETAETWKKGLAEWDQDSARIARLRAAADVRVYTPGSRAGAPLAMLASLRAAGDDEAQTQLATTAASLLALAGIENATAHSREQALIAAILAAAPATGTVDLPWLIAQIQRPAFDRMGVLDLETFYPSRDRQELALRFNSVIAAPGFDVWAAGDPLDVAALLFSPEGRPRVAVVSIAHLDEPQRMMVVSLVLNAVLAWTRRQTGTSSLRALVYMDEVFGYLPPVATPPSKLPLLTLLKQARAFGVGVMLATQNPVDLDYKALSNTGTWFLGRLQTERDKARVLDGLEGIGAGIDRATLDSMLSTLRSRVFLMHNVHEPEPVVFETRWALSYLRGPVTAAELARLRPAAAAAPPPAAGVEARSPGSAGSSKPVLPAGIEEYFLHGTGAASRLEPVLYGAARVQYTDTKRGIDVLQDVDVTTPLGSGAIAVDWDRASETAETPEMLSATPPAAAAYAPLPADALDAKRFAAWTRDFEKWLARARPLRLFAAPSLGLVSAPGESERDFRIRLQQAAHEARDASVGQLRSQYGARIDKLAARVAKAQETLAREQQQVTQQKTQTAVSVGATVLGALLGRRSVSLSTLGRATTAARGVSRSMKEAEDVVRARERVAEVEGELRALEAEAAAETARFGTIDAATMPLDVIEIKPKRGSVDVRLVALAWRPA